MAASQELQRAIRLNQPIPPLLDGWIRPPRESQNKLVTWAKAFFGEEKCKEMLYDAIKDNLFSTIKDNQDNIAVLSSTEGRKWLHANLDKLLDFLSSEKFQTRYHCPRCHCIFSGKKNKCPACKVELKWNL